MIKIMTVLHTTPDARSYRTLCFENILKYIRTKTDTHITWLVYTPDKLETPLQNDQNCTILDMHDFRNAVEAIQKVKPDVIWAAPTLNVPDYAMSLAGKFLGIPVVGELVNELFIKTDQLHTVKTYISQFFQSSVPSDTHIYKKQFMRRGRFFIYKYLFLLRTQRAVKLSMLKIIEDFFMLIRAHLRVMKHLHDPRFACNLHFVETESLIESLVKKGFERSTLIVTGIPMYDSIFQKFQKLPPNDRKDNKIRVLLLTHAMYEHGFWTKNQRDSLVRGIVSEICKHKNEISLVVKIHPSSEILSEYKSIINPLDPSIPIHQQGDVIDFFHESDVVIAYSTESALVYALVMEKPIIICDPHGLERDLLLERDLVMKCENLAQLVPAIKSVILSNPATKQKVDAFVQEFFYKLDGLASERTSDAILHLLKN